jgi:hypothetical protein
VVLPWRAGPERAARRGSREGVAPEKKGEREGADRWGRAGGMTEKEGITEERARMTERKEGMTDLLSCFLPFLFQINSILFEFNPYALNQIKLMHQHECTNMLNLK